MIEKFVSITEICDFQGGTQPPKSEWKLEQNVGYIRMLQIRDFTQPDKNNIAFVKEKTTLKKCQSSDILIGRYGASIGKILTGLEGAYNVAIMKTIPDEQRLLKSYLYYILRGDSFQLFIKNIGNRAAQAGFNKVELERFKIPLPPLSEQKHIAKILDKADALRKKNKQLLATYNELLQATFLDMFGDPVRNEKDWNTERLDEITKLERGRFSPRPRNDPSYFNGSYPFIQTGDISKSGNRLNSFTQTLNEKGIKVSKKFVKGTIVIAIVGATIGATALLEIDVYATDSIIGITANQELVNNYFLEFVMQLWKPILLKNAPEAARANINLEILGKLKIIHPPINLQNKFAQIVKNIEAQKALLKNSIQESEDLFNGLVQKAFKGEL